MLGSNSWPRGGARYLPYKILGSGVDSIHKVEIRFTTGHVEGVHSSYTNSKVRTVDSPEVSARFNSRVHRAMPTQD